MTLPRLSLVLLTSNDADAIASCLHALGRQHVVGFEVIVVDSGSSDGTVAAVRAQRLHLPFPVRLVDGKRMPVGLARDLGVALARAPFVAFVRPDARPGPDWVAHAIDTLAVTDLAFRPAGPRPRGRATRRVQARARPVRHRRGARPASTTHGRPRPGRTPGHVRTRRTTSLNPIGRRR